MVSELNDEKSIQAILVFWFKEISPESWFKKDPLFDDMLTQKFGQMIEQPWLDNWTNGHRIRTGVLRLSFF